MVKENQVPNLRCVLSVVVSGLLFTSLNFAWGQPYPAKLIRFITSEAGGGSDLAARILLPMLSRNLGQSIVVDNRSGGVIAGEAVAKAPPDGHTLLVYGNTFWMLPLMRANVSYDPVRDFMPITTMATTPAVLVVHPSVPATSVRELVALAKARPGALNYASAAIGTSNHLAAELFKSMLSVNIVRIGFKGAATALTSVVAGETQLMFAIVSMAMPQAKAGKLRALAVTSANPSALAPGLPTLVSAGLPGFDVAFVVGIFAPAGTPVAVIERLNREIVRLIERAEIKERHLSLGLEAVSSTPDEFASVIKNEMTVMGKIIRDAGIREE
jgi:tripartite-type tricarboxylate transporter receptor subunit TctC